VQQAAQDTVKAFCGKSSKPTAREADVRSAWEVKIAVKGSLDTMRWLISAMWSQRPMLCTIGRRQGRWPAVAEHRPRLGLLAGVDPTGQPGRPR